MTRSLDESSFEFRCEEFKRGRWKCVQSFTDLEEAELFTKQRALRTLELTRLVRYDVSPLNVFCYAR